VNDSTDFQPKRCGKFIQGKEQMTLNPSFTPTAKRNLLFVPPVILLILINLDIILLQHINLGPVSWVCIALILLVCVLGITSTQLSTGSSKKIIFAGISYAIINIIWDIYLGLQILNTSIVDRVGWVTSLPISSAQIHIYLFENGFHAFISNVLNLMLTLSIPILLLGVLLPAKSAPMVPVSTLNSNTTNQSNYTTRKREDMATNKNPDAQWLVKMPGQPDNAVDTSTLQMWARSGVIRSDTLVVEISSNMSYQASQIPGVFSTKSYVTAMLLSFFVGTFGVDRFYLGQTGLGIGKLLTFGGCGVWSLVDFILIAMRKVTDSQGNPLA
jgi:TM2 domain